MVAVDVEVALRFDLEVDHAMAGDLVEHVVEEGTPVELFDVPVPSRSTLTRICVSLVLRRTSRRDAARRPAP